MIICIHDYIFEKRRIKCMILMHEITYYHVEVTNEVEGLFRGMYDKEYKISMKGVDGVKKPQR